MRTLQFCAFLATSAFFLSSHSIDDIFPNHSSSSTSPLFSSFPFSSVLTPAAGAVRVGIIGPAIGSVAPAMMAVYDGFRLAMYDQNAKGGIQGQPIEWTFLPSHQSVNGTEVLIAEQMADQLMGNNATKVDCFAFGPSTDLVQAMDRVALKYNTTVFGPTSGERSDFLQYSTRMVLTTAMPDIEMAALIRYIVLTRNLKRIGVMVNYGSERGNDLIPYIRTLLAEFGLEVAHIYQVGEPGVTPAAMVQAAVSKRVQALIQLAYFGTATLYSIIAYASSINRQDDWIIGCPVIGAPLITTAFSLLTAGSIGTNNVVTTVYTPMIQDTDFEIIQSYRRLITQHAGTMAFNLTAFEGVNNAFSAFSLAGFLISNLMISVFESMGNNPINAQSIVDKTFSGWAIPASDYVFGPYSKPCAGKRNILCGCHSGQRNVDLAVVDENFRLNRIPSATVSISLDVCLPMNIPIQSPLIQLVASPSLDTSLSADLRALLTATADQFTAGDRAGYLNLSTSPSSRTGILLRRNYSAVGDLVDVQANRLTTVSTGSVYMSKVDAVSTDLTAVLDPIYIVPPLYSGYSERVIHLAPTLQQEIHAIASVYADGSSSGGGEATGFSFMTTASSDSHFVEGVREACIKSSHTFGQDSFGGVLIVGTIADGLATAASANVMVHGIATHADIAAINAFLGRHPAARVIVPFHHLTLWYDAIVAAVTEPARRVRVVFATNMPSWNPTATGYAPQTALMRAYYEAMASEGLPHSPQTLRGYLTQRLVANIVERIPSKLMQETFLSTLYAVSVVVLDSAAYSVGPVSNAACASSSTTTNADGTTSTEAGSTNVLNCQTNIGARHVWVRTLEGVAADDVMASPIPVAQLVAGEFLFTSGAIEYQELPEEPGLAVIAIVFIVVGVVAFVAVVIGLAVFFVTGRSHASAPKDDSKPFTIIFTDIQSSTSLWAEIPEEMGKALEVHHAIIRDLISKHNGYEVKTIGDAFMIAFKSADDAVKLAFALQYAFYECEEFSPSVDRAYISFDHERQLNNMSGVPIPNLSCDLTMEDYGARWRGIRVRVGINTDFGSILKDPVTKAYDYYGNITNTASRVESVSHGGQVCFTDGTLQNLSSSTVIDICGSDVMPASEMYRVSKSAGPCVAVRLGEKELRGLAKSIRMYQLECVPGRLYPPLRLEMIDEEDMMGLDDGDDGVSGDLSVSHGSSGGGGDENNNVTCLVESPNGGEGDGILAMMATGAYQGGGRTAAGGGGGAGGKKSESSTGSEAVGPSGGNHHLSAVPKFVSEVSSLHILLAIFTVFSRLPSGDKKQKEYRRLCDLWGAKVDRRTVEKAANWSQLKPTNEVNSNRMIASHLTKDDATAAAHLEALSRRVRNLVSKNLQNSVVATHGANALRAAGGGPHGDGVESQFGGGGFTNKSSYQPSYLGGPVISNGNGSHIPQKRKPSAANSNNTNGGYPITNNNTTTNLNTNNTANSSAAGRSPRVAGQSYDMDDHFVSNGGASEGGGFENAAEMKKMATPQSVIYFNDE